MRVEWDERGMQNVRRWRVYLLVGRVCLFVGRVGKGMRYVANPVSWVSQQSVEKGLN